MSDPNPYASPRTAANAGLLFTAGLVGAWRQGDFLRMHRRAELPRVCVFTGEEHDIKYLPWDFAGPGDKHSFQIVLEPQQARLSIPMKAEILAGYGWKSPLLLAGIPAGAAWAGAAALLARNGLPHSELCLAGAVVSFLLAGYATLTRPTLAVYDINAHHIWLRGASHLFLGRLPEWPYDPD